jgi:transcriptional regulator with XRE-family HTH domain
MATGQTRTFGDWLKNKRVARGLSQTNLAGRSGVTKGYISNLERNIRQPISNELVKPSPAVVDKLAKALDASTTEARLIAGYAPVGETAAPGNEIDYELEHLFHDSRNWSEENRREAYENAKVIFRRYQEKERQKTAEKTINAVKKAPLEKGRNYLTGEEATLEEYERSQRDYENRQKNSDED